MINTVFSEQIISSYRNIKTKINDFNFKQKNIFIYYHEI